MIKIRELNIAIFLLAALAMSSCKNRVKSPTTGWDYNNPENGGFEVVSNREQITPPNMVFIEGGFFVMGATQEDVLYDWDNIPRRVTVSSFYMDETEVRNLDYLEYIYWLGRVYGEDYPKVVQNALPDTLVWRERLAYNEPLVENYFRHPAYHYYPVVGVSWLQANDFAFWRTDRVNELLLIQEGILDWDLDQKNENNFNTEAYLAGQYEGVVKNGKKNLNPNGEETRRISFSDGILLPKFRLPTEAEWEYAALSLIGNSLYERIVERRRYPWNGSYVRTDERTYEGSFLANFKRGRGDYMGVAGNLNDFADIPAPVGSYWPNDFGLYNMAGNVSEWVFDVYRPTTFQDVSDLNPVRGNVFTDLVKDEQGNFIEKDSLGHMRRAPVDAEATAHRKNYTRADNINYRDGDEQSGLDQGEWMNVGTTSATTKMYDYGGTTLISDKSRVYKGASWRDNAYFLSPGVRRFLNEDEASATIGFRCAMSRVGSTVPNPRANNTRR
ncbi:MAG: gliding motility lipoprotein GldJ [Hyphomicrobiales bacterium]